MLKIFKECTAENVFSTFHVCSIAQNIHNVGESFVTYNLLPLCNYKTQSQLQVHFFNYFNSNIHKGVM